MLQLEGVSAGYGAIQVLREVSLSVAGGEILCLMGRNGAGKTTTLQTIMGLLRPTAGDITLEGQSLGTLPAHHIPLKGIGYVPQGRRLFTGLTVEQNLSVALQAVGHGRTERDAVLALFPRLRDRLHQPAQTLSGGEQQMLATARALCLKPKVLLLDEPTEGLQPSIIETIQTVVVKMRTQGVAVVLVEQRVDAVLEIADRVTFIENGRTMDTLAVDALRQDGTPFGTYLGV